MCLYAVCIYTEVRPAVSRRWSVLTQAQKSCCSCFSLTDCVTKEQQKDVKVHIIKPAIMRYFRL